MWKYLQNLAVMSFIMALAVNASIAPVCLSGRSLPSPTPSPNLVNCPQYRDLACCSADVDEVIIPSQNATQLYGFNWDQCGSLSPACQKFFQAESCYFECDPYQAPWKDQLAKDPSGFSGIPVCSTYCHSWFDACKDDYTCGTEWLVDFEPVQDENGTDIEFRCSSQSQCKKFSEIFDNAQGMCDLLWGAAFHYSEDLNNCVLWDFGLTTGNPNKYVEKQLYAESYCNTTYIESLPPPPKKTKQNPQCLPGRELETPSHQSNLKNCPRYSEMSCCGKTTDSFIDSNNIEKFGYEWDVCGKLSPKCEAFFKAEACYFHCDPYQSLFANPTLKNPSTFIGIPVCAKECNAWFDACKDDLTCGNEWLIDFVKADPNNPMSHYTCAPDTQCLTFAQVFNTSQGLCDMLWGAYYHYSEDETNCVSWTFSGENPHKYLHKQAFGEGYCVPKFDPKMVAIICLSVFLCLTFFGSMAFIAYLIVREKRQEPVFGVPMKRLDQ